MSLVDDKDGIQSQFSYRSSEAVDSVRMHRLATTTYRSNTFGKGGAAKLILSPSGLLKTPSSGGSRR